MSLIGIDVGSSSVKAGVYQEDGRLITIASHEIQALHPQPGYWETNPESVWHAATACLGEIAAHADVKKDPPKALAISASGRENFPADEQGKALGNNIMGADIRGEEFEKTPEGSKIPEDWTLECGHPRERMDPVFRLKWWQKYHPEIIQKTKYYPDWHSFLTLRLCGRNVSEPSLAARWCTYDLRSNGWSEERLSQFAVDRALLPEVMPWGTTIGEIKRRLADELGLPPDLKISAGGHDMNCACIGAGAARMGDVCLTSGSYENMVIPTELYPSASMLMRGLSMTPHMGAIARSIYAVCPTGNAVLNWARETVGVSIEEATKQLAKDRLFPSPVMSLPYLSGAMLYWQGGRKLRGALLGLTLATSKVDIVQAFMESIAYDHANTFAMIREEGIKINTIRAVGGGTRSEWWTQLKADILQTPIQVSAQAESGTFGAALIAGYGLGIYHDLDEASRNYSGTHRIYEPDQTRGSYHQERLEEYRRTVPVFLNEIY